MTNEPLILHPADIELIDRGAGVRTTPLVGNWNRKGNQLTTGVTEFEPGKGIAMHSHNVEETVMVIEGQATVVIGDKSFDVEAGDVTWIPAGVPHYFRNRGERPMRIYWVYVTQQVTRTLTESGVTIEHLSEADRRVAT
jgi:mannose-6-phosphate isomerase-like protein (cupin superfamily)